MVKKLDIKAKKPYYCCICHKEIERNYRLVLYQWGLHKYGFGIADHFDFCDGCFSKFYKWIDKYKIEGE